VQRSISAVFLFVLVAGTAAQEFLSDPTRAFVEGYDPSENDFLANVQITGGMRRTAGIQGWDCVSRARFAAARRHRRPHDSHARLWYSQR
jgi:hypothetical protein